MKTDAARKLILIAIIIIEIMIFSQEPRFLTAGSLFETLRNYTEIGIIAFGMTFIIMTRGIDLSLGSLIALVSVTVGFTYQAGVPFGISIVMGLLVGILGGAFNGFMIVKGKLHPFVVTLGTYSLYRGLSYAVTNAKAVSVFPGSFALLGRYYIGGVVPAQLFIWAIIGVIIWIVFAKTPFGTYVSAIGYNEEAAKFSGIRSDRIKIAIYVLMGLLVGIAAIIYTSRLSTARGNAAIGMELNVIAAVVLGGTDIKGGKGTIGGTVLGVAILAILNNGLTMISVRGDWALFITGIFILASILLNRILGKNVE
ncbi:MAG TPA: ABC transporter permease [Anaerovoracaceae bacterium]|nr:ABC transporter permease [Anaerovoracaceae bacterium]